MVAHERIAAAIVAATKSGRPALVPFITAGYPQLDSFVEPNGTKPARKATAPDVWHLRVSLVVAGQSQQLP